MALQKELYPSLSPHALIIAQMAASLKNEGPRTMENGATLLRRKLTNAVQKQMLPRFPTKSNHQWRPR